MTCAYCGSRRLRRFLILFIPYPFTEGYGGGIAAHLRCPPFRIRNIRHLRLWV